MEGDGDIVPRKKKGTSKFNKRNISQGSQGGLRERGRLCNCIFLKGIMRYVKGK